MASLEMNTAAWVALALLVAATVVALALLTYVARHARASRGDASPAAARPEPRALAPGESATLDDLLAGGAAPDRFLTRFVTDASGARVGESITVADDALVVKAEGAFLAIPLADVTAQDDALTLREGWDAAAAAAAGDAWRRASETPLQFDDKGNPIG